MKRIKLFEDFEEDIEESDPNRTDVYLVELIERNYGHVYVEANSVEDAKEKAHYVYEEGNTYWGNSHIEWEEPKIQKED